MNRSKSLKARALQKQDNAKFLRKRSEQNSVRMKFVCSFAENCHAKFFQLSHKCNRKTALKLFSTGNTLQLHSTLQSSFLHRSAQVSPVQGGLHSHE